jgi:hypothetical protein
MLISSKVYHLQFPLIKNQRTEILVQLLERLPKFMITCAFSLREQGVLTVQVVAGCYAAEPTTNR